MTTFVPMSQWGNGSRPVAGFVESPFGGTTHLALDRQIEIGVEATVVGESIDCEPAVGRKDDRDGAVSGLQPVATGQPAGHVDRPECGRRDQTAVDVVRLDRAVAALERQVGPDVPDCDPSVLGSGRDPLPLRLHDCDRAGARIRRDGAINAGDSYGAGAGVQREVALDRIRLDRAKVGPRLGAALETDDSDRAIATVELES